MQFSERELPPFPRRKGIEYNCPDLLLFVYAIERHWIILSAYCLYYFNVYKIFFYFYEVTWDCSYPQNYYLYDFKILFQEFSYNEVYEEPNPSDGKWSENHSVVSDFTNPWTVCSLPDSSIHGILQARILEWAAHSLVQGIFPTQRSNPGLPHCRWILYCLSHQGSPRYWSG